ncbi:hypothetical protein LCGC14_1828850 [marine sediment metagenome]|uniref:Uncharacterized protein n=1 Tax=marine sediment metagenome TaxID=412755 RepID=A0A0F9JG74_9ZZZZ
MKGQEMSEWKADNGVMVSVDRNTLTIRQIGGDGLRLIAVINDSDTLGQIGAELQRQADYRQSLEGGVEE